MADTPSAIPQGTLLISVGHHLERIADRVTNLAEDIVFIDTGNSSAWADQLAASQGPLGILRRDFHNL